jgi:ABC-2 type transport system ATP-binding protein
VRAAIGLARQCAAVDENMIGRENLRLIGQLTHQPRPAVAACAEELLDRIDLRTAATRPVRLPPAFLRREAATGSQAGAPPAARPGRRFA